MAVNVLNIKYGMTILHCQKRRHLEIINYFFLMLSLELVERCGQAAVEFDILRDYT